MGDYTMKRQLIGTAMLSMVAVMATGATGVPGFDMPWYTIDGGGTDSTGERFVLSGTIGQPDAGQMSGDRFTLTGGFRFAQVPTDCNSDGTVNLHDHALFEACLTGPGHGYQDAACRCFDLDADGDVDLIDNATIQRMFGM